MREAIERHTPDVIVNAAAYTAVDRAESDAEGARLLNTGAPGLLAHAARNRGVRLIHLSTDFVFDGMSSTPYAPTASPNPLSTYGRTKLEGEHAVLEVLGERAIILRSSWIYHSRGQNFVRSMLRLMREKRAVRVVADQIGTPTAASSLARVIWKLVYRPDIGGVHHWSDSGVASWYDFAVAIAEEAEARGLISTGG